VSTQPSLPQYVVVPRHSAPHIPPAQVGVPPEILGQTVAQSPQCEVSVSVETQLSPHASVPFGQPMTHFPPAHTRSVSHFAVHPPQWSASDVVSTQAPSQSVRPVAHVMSQPLSVHTALPFGGAGHFVSHLPQLSVSASRRTQTPWHGE
jgi:hypothetical protein